MTRMWTLSLLATTDFCKCPTRPTLKKPTSQASSLAIPSRSVSFSLDLSFSWLLFSSKEKTWTNHKLRKCSQGATLSSLARLVVVFRSRRCLASQERGKLPKPSLESSRRNLKLIQSKEVSSRTSLGVLSSATCTSATPRDSSMYWDDST